MNDVPGMDEADTGHDLSHEHLALVLRQLVLGVGYSLKQIPAWQHIMRYESHSKCSFFSSSNAQYSTDSKSVHTI